MCLLMQPHFNNMCHEIVLAHFIKYIINLLVTFLHSLIIDLSPAIATAQLHCVKHFLCVIFLNKKNKVSLAVNTDSSKQPS